MKKNSTKLDKIHIKSFRALKNIEIELGNRLTVICGKNGTSKSSILGLAAHAFNFEKDYTSNEELPYRTITGNKYVSLYKDHLRISQQFDAVGSMDVNIQIHDGYTQEDAVCDMEFQKRGDSEPRITVRNNSTVKGKEANTSRKFTHPVIFLSLRRLYPIVNRKDYKKIEYDYLHAEKAIQFIKLNNELLNRSATAATGTDSEIKSTVAHTDKYDQDSVSAGEDNAGQIILAIMSFRKLKEEYKNYKGGLLLIDEADSALFPAAQIKLIDMLHREARELNLQVILTSHSPTLIQHAYELGKQYQKDLRIIYLSDTYGDIQVCEDYSWNDIDADLNTKTVTYNNNISLPKINVYFEDKEAYGFFQELTLYKKFKKFINLYPDISLGCSNYIQLAKKKIPEFSRNSIICLDGDAKKSSKGINSIVVLPSELSPEQLIFEYLYNLPKNNGIWENKIRFSRSTFTNIGRDIISELDILNDEKINLKTIINDYHKRHNNNDENQKKLRVLFKKFYNNNTFKSFLENCKVWNSWKSSNQDLCDDFIERFTKQLKATMQDTFKVSEDKLRSLFNKNKAGQN